jgi:hypothetical protein
MLTLLTSPTDAWNERRRFYKVYLDINCLDVVRSAMLARRTRLRRISPSFLFNNFQTAPSQRLFAALSFHQLTNPSFAAIDSHPASFHQPTNRSSRNSFPFSSIQNPGVWGPRAHLRDAGGGPFRLSSRHSPLATRHALITPLFVALPYVSRLSSLSTAFAHFDGGGRVHFPISGILTSHSSLATRHALTCLTSLWSAPNMVREKFPYSRTSGRVTCGSCADKPRKGVA